MFSKDGYRFQNNIGLNRLQMNRFLSLILKYLTNSNHRTFLKIFSIKGESLFFSKWTKRQILLISKRSMIFWSFLKKSIKRGTKFKNTNYFWIRCPTAINWIRKRYWISFIKMKIQYLIFVLLFVFVNAKRKNICESIKTVSRKFIDLFFLIFI